MIVCPESSFEVKYSLRSFRFIRAAVRASAMNAVSLDAIYRSDKMVNRARVAELDSRMIETND
ncbi:hypothetical protein PTKU64_48620 [Paraburkholderia terrae]|uniref:Uncharacterized protein n=1 Tax=Paraburkholderia terrae TaxID=311230 RepID=A0ABM7TS00_9BURK|nr:hypothetical protein PTKU64_48620 [Paraburkholderia terrae]BDC40351.1 hypothetical protein PTKU15_36480 [Paraburkholderia terrae]